MNQIPHPKTRVIKNFFRAAILITGAVLCAVIIFSFPAFSQQSSYIKVTRVAFLSFAAIPESVHLGSFTVSGNDRELTTQSGGLLNGASVLMVKDTRTCGGFEVQLSSSTPEFPVTRVITSTAIDPEAGITGSINNNLVYITGFSGDTSASAPHNTTCLDFSDGATYNSAGCTSTNNNIVGSVRTLISGALTAPVGRNGQIAAGVAFHTLIPKYTPSGEYRATLTYTLLDSTSGSCP